MIAIALGALAVAWAMTLPLHRYKEMRPKTPRDVGSEVTADGTVAVHVSASYRSARCGCCSHECTWFEVAPVLSWIRGCPRCGTPLPATVPLLQIGLPLAVVATVASLPGSWAALPFAFLAVVLAAISIVDLRIWLIPYWMPWAGAACGLVLIAGVSVLVFDQPGLILKAILGAVVTFAVFFVLFVAAPGKLGFSDVRLAFMLGLFLAWFSPLLPIYGLLFGAVLGIVMGLTAKLVRGDSRFPFGPALALGAMAAVWLHESILRAPL